MTAKRKLFEPAKPKNTEGPIDKWTGQRLVFPEVVSVSGRDSEWRYDEDLGEKDNDGVSEMEGLIKETYSSDMLTTSDKTGMHYGDSAVEDEEEEENEVGEVEEDEWEVEPQTEAIAYLQSVRAEAVALPAVTYVPQRETDASVQKSSPAKTKPPTKSNNLWETQFLQYYSNLRETLINAPEPNLSQDELDDLLHINPHNRPDTSSQEDRLWRLK